MDARNTFSVLGLLDGDATVGALRFALRGAHPSALRLPSSPFGAASSARGHPSARVGASSSTAIGLPAARVGASSSAAIGLPAAHVGATSSAAIGLPAAHVGATSSAVLGLPTALPGASSSSIRGKDVSSEVEHRHFGHTVDTALLLAPADPEEGWTKVKPAAKHRAPRAVAAPHPAPVTPAAAEPEDELREIRGGPGLRGPRMRDITKWILVTEVSRAGLCGRSLRHQI